MEWFEIDLGEEYNVDRVEVVNRNGCCGERLENTMISAGKTPNPTDMKSSRLAADAPELGDGAVWTWELTNHVASEPTDWDTESALV